MKSPSPFVQKEPVAAKPNAVAPVAEVKPHAPRRPSLESPPLVCPATSRVSSSTRC
jgi:hypothetical protein